MWTVNFQMFKLDLEKAVEPEIKLTTSVDHQKKQDRLKTTTTKQTNKQKTPTSAVLTIPKPLPVWITITWKILEEMRIPNHLTCLLRNLYAGQKAKIRSGHWTKDWFQTRKGLVKDVYCHPAYLPSMQSTSREMLDWMKHKLESRLMGEISIPSDMQMIPPLCQKGKNN